MTHNEAREVRSASQTDLHHLWEVGLDRIALVLPEFRAVREANPASPDAETRVKPARR
jgi:hypothetical protein